MNQLLAWLALRGFRFKKGFFSFSFFIAVLGVIVGVAALIVVNAVMTGFQDSIRERLLSSNADIIVMKKTSSFTEYREAEEVLRKIPHVKGVESFVYLPVMATSSNLLAQSASLRGCYPEKEPTVTNIPKKLVLGSWEIFKKEKEGVVIGSTLANNLGITVGDKITLLSPKGRKTPFGFIPRTASFKVVGIFEVGMYQFDSSLILAHIEEVRKKFGFKDEATGIMVKIDNLDNLELVKKEIEKKLGKDFIVEDWISLNKSLFSALKLEKLAMFLVLVLIVIVASFNISSLLMMNVNAKAKDIAILKTVGAEDSFILKVFMVQGLIIGIIGTIIGEILGVSIAILGEKYKLIPLPADVYYIDHLPFKIHILDCILAAVCAVAISILATIYPARRASKTEPVKVLKMGES
jgi:lipoprotein-releasing system permease protein